MVQHRVVAALADEADFYAGFFQLGHYVKSESKIERKFRHAARRNHPGLGGVMTHVHRDQQCYKGIRSARNQAFSSQRTRSSLRVLQGTTGVR